MEDLNLTSFQIISAVGMAKSMYLEAIHLAEKGEFEKAEEKIKIGEENFTKGHQIHASLIQQETSGNGTMPNVLLIHAEDQMTACEIIKDLSQSIISLNKKLRKEEDIR